MKINQMLTQITFAFVLCSEINSVFAAGCSWIKNDYCKFHRETLELLEQMGGNNTNDLETPVAFPDELYEQAANASADVRLGFEAQVLQEVAELFCEDHAPLQFGEKKVDDFLNLIHQMNHGLLSCMKSKKPRWNKKLNLYFKRLSREVLVKKKNSAEAWEMIRREAKTHIFQASRLTPTK